MQEVPEATVARAQVFVDSVSATLAEAGDLIIPLEKGLLTKDDLGAEIGQVAAGDLPGRTYASQITFFKSVGVAVQDVAVAELVLQRAQERRLGMEVEM